MIVVSGADDLAVDKFNPTNQENRPQDLRSPVINSGRCVLITGFSFDYQVEGNECCYIGQAIITPFLNLRDGEPCIPKSALILTERLDSNASIGGKLGQLRSRGGLVFQRRRIHQRRT